MGSAIEAPDQRLAIPRTPRESTPPSTTPARQKRRLPAATVLVVLAVAVIAIARAWPVVFSHPPAQTVIASGRLEGREVTLAAKAIQGRVKRLLVDEGQTVTKGQLLAELDAPQQEAQVAAAKASVASLDAQVSQASLDVAYTVKNSEASIAAADAALSSARAHVVRANAIKVNSAAVYERALALFKAAAISRQELDLVEMTVRTSDADVAAAEKDVVRAEANVALAKASADTIGLKRQQLRSLEGNRRAAEARFEEAQANLVERLIIAPENGTIVSRPVEVGNVVTPGSPIFQVVDMRKLYVKVYVPEPDVAKLQLGDSGDVYVDAFPGRSFVARISKIYDQAEFTPKNVETAEERLKLVFGVELSFVTPDDVLKPGMPADCVIHWKPGAGH